MLFLLHLYLATQYLANLLFFTQMLAAQELVQCFTGNKKVSKEV